MAKLIRIEPVSVWRLKEHYLKHGETAFIHGNTGRTPKNKQFDYKKYFQIIKCLRERRSVHFEMIVKII